MRRSGSFPWLVGLLLAVPLVALVSWLVTGGLSRSFGPDLSPSPVAGSPISSATPVLAGFSVPLGDFSAERLHERVNGAADALRAAGCGRLLFWRIEDPPAELELLVFAEPEGAARVLDRDAGPGRAPDGPGDERSAGDQAVFFRRGRFYARLYAQPGDLPAPGRLLEIAEKVDVALIDLTRKPDAARLGTGEGSPR